MPYAPLHLTCLDFYAPELRALRALFGIFAVKNAPEIRQEQFLPTDCKIEALKLSLEFHNSVFNNKHFPQTDGYCSRSTYVQLI